MSNARRGDRLRPVSREDSFQKLRTLRCFKEVYERILAGWSMSQLASFIQEERNEYTHATKVALMQVLQRFRDSIPPAQLVSKRMPHVMEKAAEEVEEGLDELEELSRLYKLQMERIAIDASTEKKINKLMPTMTQEIRVARELLGAISDLKMDLGLTTRHLGQVEIDATLQADLTAKYGKESVQKVVDNPESRRKVLNIAERLLALPGRTEKATQEAAPEDTFTTDEELVLAEVAASEDSIEELAPDELPEDLSGEESEE